MAINVALPSKDLDILLSSTDIIILPITASIAAFPYEEPRKASLVFSYLAAESWALMVNQPKTPYEIIPLTTRLDVSNRCLLDLRFHDSGHLLTLNMPFPQPLEEIKKTLT
jgi:hypothetical protein